ncbi:MAG: hypothetical protein JKY54_10400 [Flavobacteriales bacterium]|nr:hypothetical protein [Flavobacteriales bacterium]
MKFKFLLFLGVIALTACSEQTADIENNENESVSSVPLEFEYMDEQTDPKTDFYQFCNGSWLLNNPVPDDKSKYSSFSVVSDKINKRLRLILKDVAAEKHIDGSNEQILADFYTSFMDTVHRDDIGVQHLDESRTFEFANSIENSIGIVNVLGFHHPRGINSLFNFRVEIDEKDNSQYVAYLSQGGLGLPNRGYYIDTNARSVKMRAKYKEHIAKVFELAGAKISTEDVDAIFGIEEKLAIGSRSQSENRDDNAKYNPHTAEEIASKFSALDWNKYFDKIGLTKTDKIIVQQPEFFENVNKMLKSIPINSWSLYLRWKVLNRFETMMTSDLNAEHFNFYSKIMRGRKVMEKDWKRAISKITSSPISEILGKQFVDV